MNEDIAQAIEDKGLTAPRVTADKVDAEIVAEHYFTARDGREGALKAGTYVTNERQATSDADLKCLGLMTFCVLVLRNGFTVTGESACASPENFDAGIGRKIARKNATHKVWNLLGFRLRDQLAEAKA